MNFVPLAGSWTANGDNTSAGRDMRLNLTPEGRHTNTGNDYQLGGGGVALSPDARVLYVCDTANQRVVAIKVRDGSQKWVYDCAPSWPIDVCTATTQGVRSHNLGDVYVSFIQADEEGESGAYGDGGIWRLDQDDGSVLDENYWVENTVAADRLHAAMAVQICWDSANEDVICKGKIGAVTTFLVVLWRMAGDHAGGLKVRNVANLFDEKSAPTQRAGACCVIPGYGHILHHDGVDGWQLYDLLSGNASVGDGGVIGGGSGPRRSVVAIGADDLMGLPTGHCQILGVDVDDSNSPNAYRRMWVATIDTNTPAWVSARWSCDLAVAEWQHASVGTQGGWTETPFVPRLCWSYLRNVSGGTDEGSMVGLAYHNLNNNPDFGEGHT